MKLIPAIIQDEGTNTVLMLGYMNKESLKKTQQTKTVWFYSRSKKRLWQKGEISKNYLYVKIIKFDCDKDAILIKVKPAGPTCHTGDYSCFKEKSNINPLVELFNTIEERKKNLPKNSYTAKLFRGGINKIIGKVMEETTEVINASLRETKKRLIEETADLLYHLFVLLSAKNVKLNDALQEINKRKKSAN